MADPSRSGERTDATPSGTTSRAVTVPASVPMVGVLGASDELLRVIEAAVPDADIHARGNEITVSGPSDQVGRRGRPARRDGHGRCAPVRH